MFDCLISYAESVNDDNVLSLCAQFINYRSMSLEYFVSKCVHRTLLSNELQNKVLLYLSSLHYDDANNLFIDVNMPSRTVVLDDDIFVLRSYKLSDNPSWTSDELDGDRIQFRCDSDMTLKAVSVYGVPFSSILFYMSVFLSESNKLVSECSCRVDFSENQCFSYICLKSSLTVKAYTLYTVVLRFKNKSTFFGTDCLLSSVIMKEGNVIKVNFEKVGCGSSSVSEGQFHGLLFCG